MAPDPARRPKTWLGPLSTITDITIGGCVVLLAVTVLLAGTSATGLRPNGLSFEAHVPAHLIEGLRAAPDALAPGAEFDGDVSVRMTATTAAQTALSVLTPVSGVLFVLAGAVILRRALRAAMWEGPFTLTVATRLRYLGYLAIFGGLAHALIAAITDALLLRRVLPDDHVAFSWVFTFPAPEIVIGFGMLAVSEIIRHGVRLREDVEGTI
ncbi:hypothetical protein GCM10009799_25880 [Nocardiopsis rhodophaea]|uniref:DUF2975 domain-containing protein n=1 Tax=Nocardiopsis rhodophaea TaxID=280238 RepID=A0ABN2T348_9ACTN